MNNKNLIITIVAIIVIVVGGYGAYRLYKHFNKPQSAPVAQTQTTTPSGAQAPTAAENLVYRVATNTKLGSYLIDLKGMTLYTFANDKPGISNCEGPCLKLWPAFVATGSATNLQANVTVFKRTDGTQQYAYKGMPLYYYYLDKNPGDTLGQGVKGVWFVAKP